MPIWKMGTWLRLLDCDFYSPHAFLPLSLGSCLNFDSFLQVSFYLISSIIFYWTFWDLGAPVLYFLVPVNELGWNHLKDRFASHLVCGCP
jgi:hypothetical protein